MNIDTLESGFELDRLIAEKVMGYHYREIVDGYIGHGKLGILKSSDFTPSTSIADAWKAVEHLGHRGLGLTIALQEKTGNGVVLFEGAPTMCKSFQAPDVALSICLAALRAVEVKS